MTIWKKSALVLNGFLHDLASGFWLASVIVVYLLHRFQAEHQAVAHLLGEIERLFFWSGVGAAVLILATGGARTFTYVDKAYGAETESQRRRLLIIKHIIFSLVLGGGTWLAWTMAYH